jgi:hypothetical protein
MAGKTGAHYVSNAEFLKVFIEWKERRDKAVEAEEEIPIMPDYLGMCIMKIATRLAYKGNFIGYSYRDEMVGDAIENCSRMLHKFNPDKSSNIFSYTTQICFNAFLRRIASEKKQSYIKGKMIEEMPLDELFDIQDHDGDELEFRNSFIDYLRDNNFIDTTSKPVSSKKIKVPDLAENALEQFFNAEE